MLFMKADSGSSAHNKILVFCALCWVKVCIIDGMQMSHCSACVCQDYHAGNKKTGRNADRLKTPESSKIQRNESHGAVSTLEPCVPWNSVPKVCQETQWLQRAIRHCHIQNYEWSENLLYLYLCTGSRAKQGERRQLYTRHIVSQSWKQSLWPLTSFWRLNQQEVSS